MIASLSATILSYTWIAQAAVLGAAIGTVTGLIVSFTALLASFWVRSTIAMLWVLAGSIIGAGFGFKGVVVLGGYPKGSQADLSLITLAPVGLVVGALVGTLAGILMWKYRHSE